MKAVLGEPSLRESDVFQDEETEVEGILSQWLKSTVASPRSYEMM